jgi:hypothetical protein
MNCKPTGRSLRAVVLLLCASGAGGAAHAYDYPTAERVIYVQDCMRQHPGPTFEMVSKCSCTIDKLAQKLPLDQFVAMSTATNANSIGGERGNTIRDTEMLQKQIKRFRELQAEAKKSCFIASEPVR